MFIFKLEHQRQQLLQERQQFHLEQLRSAELRQRQLAAQQLLNEGKLTMPSIVPQAAVTAPTAPIVNAQIAAAAPSTQASSSSTSASGVVPPSVTPVPININVNVNMPPTDPSVIIQRPPSQSQIPTPQPHEIISTYTFY